MVRVTVSNNVERKTVIVDGSATVADILEATGFAGANAVPMVNGDPIHNLGATLDALGVTESCSISLAKQTQNA